LESSVCLLSARLAEDLDQRLLADGLESLRCSFDEKLTALRARLELTATDLSAKLCCFDMLLTRVDSLDKHLDLLTTAFWEQNDMVEHYVPTPGPGADRSTRRKQRRGQDKDAYSSLTSSELPSPSLAAAREQAHCKNLAKEGQAEGQRKLKELRQDLTKRVPAPSSGPVASASSSSSLRMCASSSAALTPAVFGPQTLPLDTLIPSHVDPEALNEEALQAKLDIRYQHRGGRRKGKCVTPAELVQLNAVLRGRAEPVCEPGSIQHHILMREMGLFD